MKESEIFSEQNLAEKFHYVYRVTIDGYHYIGKRSGALNDLATGAYATSSNLIHEKLQNGHYFSKIKILQVFSSSEEALEFEERFLTRVNAKSNPKFLNQTNGGKDFCLKQHTEKTKEKLSEISKAQFDINTEQGRRNRKHMSNKRKEYFNPNTEEGRFNLEENRRRGREQFDINTEEGIKRRERHSEKMKEFYNTELGRKQIENHSEIMKEVWDENTEEGRQRREKQSQSGRTRFDENTEEGRRKRENAKVYAQKGAEIRLQKRKDTSILGELMFDEEFIRQNFLIVDDENNPRFLWSVYSKLTGYSKSRICQHKQKGKLSFLSGIKSIKLSEEQENSKIEEISNYQK